MPGTRNDYGQMYDHELNPRKGWGPGSPGCLEKALPIESGLVELVYAGCVVHVTTSNTFALGVNNTNDLTSCRVPCFAFQNETDFDVNPDLGNVAGGTLLGLCCLGDFELESTEFVTTANPTYTPGSYLTADDLPTSSGGNSATGQLREGTLSTHTIVGIISESGTNANGSFQNEHGQNVIRFWTWFLPETVAAATT